MKDLSKLKVSFIKQASGIARIVNLHKITILVAVVAGAIAYTTLRAQTYLSPPRNETFYTTKKDELSSFEVIDYTFVEVLRESSNDIDIDITQSQTGDRTNPFGE
jgi:hypothetical protein